MKCFNLDGDRFVPVGTPFAGESLLPVDSILLQRTPFTGGQFSWDQFWQACDHLREATDPAWVMIDACWDPFRLSNDAIQIYRDQVNQRWPRARCLVLSARAQHWFDELPGCVYFPMFLICKYPDPHSQPRQGRMGCLNRRNAAHRIWLMHHLLDQGLIDPARDIYSVRFTCMWTDHYHDIDPAHMDDPDQAVLFNQAQRQWPKILATHEDGFPNDYSTQHPAWHTGIAIITETEPGSDTLICEKTAKGILSRSCFTIYMADVGYQVLEALGFRPRFFADHAEGWNVEPILRMCRDIKTENQALDYRESYLEQIEHNFQWFAWNQGGVQQRPWFDLYQPKLQQALDSL